MIKPATVPLRGVRTNALVVPIVIEGMDLTSAVLSAAVLQNWDNDPATPEIVPTVTFGNVETVDGVPTSNMTMTIPLATMEAVPDAPEAGDDVEWIWYLNIQTDAEDTLTKQRYLEGPFYIGGTAGGAGSVGTLVARIEDQTVSVSIDGAAVLGPLILAAQDAAEEAEAAAAAAEDAAADAADAATTGILAALQPYMVEANVGRPTVASAPDAVSTGQFVFGDQRENVGRIKKMRAWGGATGGEALARVYSREGNTFTMVAERAVTVVAEVANEFEFDDFVYFPGAYLGFYSVLGTLSADSGTADSGGWYNGAVTGESFTDATPFTGSVRLQVGFLVEEASRLGGDTPLYVVADGNSLTEGTHGATPWATLLADELGITVLNFGVSGQTVSSMLIDFDEQIGAEAVQPGFRTVAIFDGEPYNEMILNSTSVSASVDKMAQWCNQARDAGYDYVGVVNSAAHNTTDNTPVEGSWNRVTTKGLLNAEIESRWRDFADFCVDIGSSPALSDYTNSTYYVSDGIHYTTAGQTIIKNRVRAALSAYR